MPNSRLLVSGRACRQPQLLDLEWVEVAGNPVLRELQEDNDNFLFADKQEAMIIRCGVSV
jgi:hypothetical protein